MLNCGCDVKLGNGHHGALADLSEISWAYCAQGQALSALDKCSGMDLIILAP